MRSHRHAANVDSHVELVAREYPHGTRARYNAQKCRCFKCRRANSAYELQRQRDPRVDAEPVRAHLAALSARGIGLRAIADATDIPRVALQRLHRGQPTIRRSLADKILATDETIIADHATVPAGETQRLLRELIREGYTRTRLAAHLGSMAKTPALQFKAERVLAKTEQRVCRLHAALLAEQPDEISVIDESPRARILSALRWFESATLGDLLDAMDVEADQHDAYGQALHRLWKAGEIERHGEGKPYLYRMPAA